MKTFLECVPCMVRQTYEATAFATDDEALQESILREALQVISGIRIDQSPPHMATAIHRMIREKTGSADPYSEAKKLFNQAGSALYQQLRGMIEASDTSFETAVRLSIAGNVIDYGAPGRPEAEGLLTAINDALSCHLFGESPDLLRKAIQDAKTILILGDNAGEIAFDRHLLEKLPLEKCAYVVRGGPVLNDATMEDAIEVGLPEIVEVIDNGSDAPGTVLEWCSPEFNNRFEKADLVIAKGQGNYETLSNAPRGNIFFLLKAKCPVIARHIGCETGDFVIQFSNGDQETTKM